MAADVNKTVSINYTATTAQLETALKRLPGISDQEAKKMAKMLDQSMKKAQKSATSAAKASGDAWKKFGKGLANVGVAAAGAGVAVLGASQHFADLTNELVDASTKSGVAIDTLAGIRLAAEGSGRSFADLEGGLIKFQEAQRGAAQGSKKQQEAFAALGVAVTDSNGKLRNTNDVFNDAVSALSKMEAGTDKNIAAMDLFGKTAGPAFIQSGAIDAMDEFTALAENYGVNVGPQAVAQAAAFQRNVASLKTVAPGSFQKIIDSLAGGGSSGQGVNMLLEGATKGIIYFTTIGGDSLALISQSFENLIGLITAASMALGGDVDGAMAIINDGVRETNDAVNNLVNTFDRASKAVDEYDKVNTATATAAVENAKNQSAAQSRIYADTKKQTQAIKEQATFEKELAALQKTANDVLLDDRDKLLAKYDAEFAKLEKLKEKKGENAELEQLEHELTLARATELADHDQAIKEQMMAMEKARHDEVIANAQKEKDRYIAVSQGIISSFGTSMQAVQTIAQNTGQLSGETAIKIHRMSQAAAVADIAMQTAVGTMRAVAAAGGQPALAAIYTAAVVAAGALQTAAVLSTPPPTMDTGGMVGNMDPLRPDETMIRALSGEAVLDRSTVRSLGGEAGVKALQKGGGMQPQIVVVSPFKHMDRYMRSALLQPTTIRNELKNKRRRGY